MAKILINFANGYFVKSQRLNCKTGLEVGGFDRVIGYRPEDIDADFLARNRAILSHSKGAGYWLWKPYFIDKALRQLRQGDFLLYSDAGAVFMDAIDALIDACEATCQDILPFDVGLPEKAFTKRDAFLLMGCDAPAYTDTTQRHASFILFRKTASTVDFVHRYLEYAQDERILTDQENRMGQDNYPEFVAHRHDQSIFSLLTKRFGLVGHRDPSQWGNGGEEAYPQSPYGQVIQHTRARNFSLSLKCRQWMERFTRY